MPGHLLLKNCVEDEPNRPAIERALKDDSLLWLDQPFAEVHCFYGEHFFVTVHRDEIPAIADACTALSRLYTDRRLVALYRLLDALVDSMFPFLRSPDPDQRHGGQLP